MIQTTLLLETKDQRDKLKAEIQAAQRSTGSSLFLTVLDRFLGAQITLLAWTSECFVFQWKRHLDESVYYTLREIAMPEEMMPVGVSTLFDSAGHAVIIPYHFSMVPVIEMSLLINLSTIDHFRIRPVEQFEVLGDAPGIQHWKEVETGARWFGAPLEDALRNPFLLPWQNYTLIKERAAALNPDEIQALLQNEQDSRWNEESRYFLAANFHEWFPVYLSKTGSGFRHGGEAPATPVGDKLFQIIETYHLEDWFRQEVEAQFRETTCSIEGKPPYRLDAWKYIGHWHHPAEKLLYWLRNYASDDLLAILGWQREDLLLQHKRLDALRQAQANAYLRELQTNAFDLARSLLLIRTRDQLKQLAEEHAIVLPVMRRKADMIDSLFAQGEISRRIAYQTVGIPDQASHTSS